MCNDKQQLRIKIEMIFLMKCVNWIIDMSFITLEKVLSSLLRLNLHVFQDSLQKTQPTISIPRTAVWHDIAPKFGVERVDFSLDHLNSHFQKTTSVN